MERFRLLCLECGAQYADFRMRCEKGCNSLLRSRYAERRFLPRPVANIFKFADWLPCHTAVDTGVGPVLVRAERYGDRLGLENLYVAFNGYWPERGATNPTGTFKDFEALPTILNLRERGRRRVILASAGNTARAFAHAARELAFDVYIVIPEGMLHRLWLPAGGGGDERVKVIAIRHGDDYFEAIRVADALAQRYGIDAEGGARNVARRDGLGTVLLEAARVLERLPDHYFQAVGSGSGAIGVYEAALRLRADERFREAAPPRLHLSQNAPFLPIYRAWNEGWTIDPAAYGPATMTGVYASVLANRNPPYAIRGGVREALDASGGWVYAVDSPAAVEAGRRFTELEGIDLEPASAVAVASLEQALAAGRIGRGEVVLVNVTGGGLERIRRDFDVQPVEPALYLDPDDLEPVAALL